MSKTSSHPPTELIERYLQAVAFWLSKGQQQDIIAELSEDLHSQIEEKETEFGRSLNDTEIEAVLKQRGRPVLVANRYLPQWNLIGPVLFPIYWFVIKVVALCYLVPWVLVWIGMMSFSSSYRAEHTSAGWFGAIGSAWSAWWFTAVVALGTVTLVFAVLEQVQAKSRLLENWNPRKLAVLVLGFPAIGPDQCCGGGCEPRASLLDSGPGVYSVDDQRRCIGPLLLDVERWGAGADHWRRPFGGASP
ncbi:MAG: hypothetical protein WA741_10990 [Candidatus Sulfotelmatobacter sp.]